jgi:phosphonate transport system permease protein
MSAFTVEPPDGKTLRETALAERATLEARYPGFYAVGWRRRGTTLGAIAALAAVAIFGVATLDVSWTRVWAGMGRLGEFVVLMLPPSYGSTATLELYLLALAQTLAIAFLGTLLGAVIAFPLGFLAARNVVTNPFGHFAVRRALDTIRAVDVLIWALMWINVVGLGPFAGILAIMTQDIGIFGKLFSEAIEAADRKPVEGILSTGGNRWAAVRFGLIPQVLPVFLSQVLYFIESNTRSATIIGIVGAGGIGQALAESIQELEWRHVAFLVAMILATVVLIDHISARLRFAVIGARPSTV